ncbi:MAG: hypothetical protein MJ211_00125 [Bacteroidales bacterium]|nr:hypothetical protein [Bacteroidales bacterium]
MNLKFLIFLFAIILTINSCQPPQPKQFECKKIGISFTGYEDMQISSNDDEIFNCFNDNIGVCIQLTDAENVNNIDSLAQHIYYQKTQNLALDSKIKLNEIKQKTLQNNYLDGYYTTGADNGKGVNWIFVLAKSKTKPLIYFMVISYTREVDENQLNTIINSFKTIPTINIFDE